jgi:hypothetical protein
VWWIWWINCCCHLYDHWWCNGSILDQLISGCAQWWLIINCCCCCCSHRSLMQLQLKTRRSALKTETLCFVHIAFWEQNFDFWEPNFVVQLKNFSKTLEFTKDLKTRLL